MSRLTPVKVGDAMGFFLALNVLGSLTPDEMVEYTGLDEQYVHDWMHHDASIRHITYSPRTRRFSLTPEQAEAVSQLGARIDARC